MPGPTIPGDGYGLINWTNNVDNWREEDAEWTQGRVALRWANTTSRATSGGDALGPGSLSYVANTKTFAVNTGTAASGWSFVLHSPQLTYTDTIGSNFLVKLSGGSGLAFYSDGVFAETRLAIAGSNASPKVKIEATGITVETSAGNPGIIYSNNSGQIGVSAANGAAINKLSVSGSASFASTVSFAAATTFNSTVTVNSAFSVSGATVGAGGVSTPTGVVSALSFATQNPNGYQLGTTGLSRASNAGAAITIANSAPAMSGNNVDLMTPSSGAVRITSGSVTAPVAAYMTSNSTPGSTPAPDGTIWFQV